MIDHCKQRPTKIPIKYPFNCWGFRSTWGMGIKQYIWKAFTLHLQNKWTNLFVTKVFPTWKYLPTYVSLFCCEEKVLQNSHSFIMFYTYSAAPSGGHIFNNKSSWNSTPKLRNALCNISLPKMRKLIKTLILTFRKDIDIAMHYFFRDSLYLWGVILILICEL